MLHQCQIAWLKEIFIKKEIRLSRYGQKAIYIKTCRAVYKWCRKTARFNSNLDGCLKFSHEMYKMTLRSIVFLSTTLSLSCQLPLTQIWTQHCDDLTEILAFLLRLKEALSTCIFCMKLYYDFYYPHLTTGDSCG